MEIVVDMMKTIISYLKFSRIMKHIKSKEVNTRECRVRNSEQSWVLVTDQQYCYRPHAGTVVLIKY